MLLVDPTEQSSSCFLSSDDFAVLPAAVPLAAFSDFCFSIIFDLAPGLNAFHSASVN
jgi:hypothetical protein